MEMVTISKEEYERLLESSEFLDCLEACGVSDWRRYYEARDMMEEE